MVFLLISCSGDFQYKIQEGKDTCLVDANSCARIERFAPIVAKTGAIVTAYGKNISPRTQIVADGVAIETKVLDATSLSFVMPAGKIGFVAIEASRGGRQTQLAASSRVYRLEDGVYPVVTLDPALVCSDIQFINGEGVLLTGTKVCNSQNLENLKAENVKAGITIGDVVGELTTPAPCAQDGEASCVTHAGFKAVNASLLTAGNIKSGVTLGGQLGAYPSLAHPLSGADTTPDLTAFGPAVATGSYEFFDSAGIRYTGTLADGGTLTAGTSNQTLAAANTFYRQVVLAGDSDLTAINIKDTIEIFGITGNLSGTLPNCSADGAGSCMVDGSNYRAAALAGAANKIISGQSLAGVSGSVTLPVAANVLTGSVAYGIPGSLITPSYSPDFPAIANVRSSDTVDGVQGTLADCSSDGSIGCVVLGPSYAALLKAGAQDKILSENTIGGVGGNVTLPAVTKVLLGTNYGVNNSGSVGTLTLPVAANVLAGTSAYGEPGLSLTPAYSPDFPAVSNVLTTDTVNGVIGTLTLPLASKVLMSTSYGVGGNGSTGTLTLPTAGNVLTGSGSYGEAGSSLTPAYSPDFPLAANVRSSDTVNSMAGTLNDCSAGNQAGCVSTSTFKSMDLTSATAMTDLTMANFNATIATAANFEFWDSTGTRHQVTGDADLAAANILSTATLFGVGGSATLESHSNCSAANQSGCVATTIYKTMNLTAAGTGTGLTASNFNTTINAAGIFEFWDAIGSRHSVAGDTNLTAAKILSGQSIFGVSGSVTPSPADCSSAGSQSCVATGSYYAATSCAANGSACYLPAYVLTTQPLKAIDYDNVNTNKAKVRMSLAISGITGTLADCASDGDAGCVAVGPTYAAAITAGAASKILSSQSLAGVSGNVTLPAVGKVLTGTSFGVSGTGSSGTLTIPAASNVLTDSGTYGDPGALLTPSYSPDFPAVGNVLNTDTVNSASGTLTLPTAGNVYTGITYGVAGTGSTGTLTIPTVANVRTGNGAYGVGGTGSTPTLADCAAANASGCVATATYKTMDLGTLSGVGLTSANFNTTIAAAPTFEFWTATGARQTVAGDTNLSVGNVKSGVAIYGVTGDYPSATYTLPSASGTADLDTATFDAKVKSATAFEYWNSAGQYQTGAGDADITAANILSNVTIFGMEGSATAGSTSCTYGTQGTCEADAACRWNTGACQINPWNIRIGTTIAGTAGSLKTNCRNAVNTARFNWDGVVTGLVNTASATSSTNYDYWDTIDDYLGFPPNRVTAFSSDTLCDSSVWSDVTTNDGGASLVACGTSSQCIYKDQISGLKVTGILAAGGNTTNTVTPGTFAWNAAMQKCAASTYGGYTAGTWRLPTQKELMALYAHGMVSLAGANFITLANMQNYFWSASSISNSTLNAWYIDLAGGDIYYNNGKTNTYRIICIR